MDFTELTHELLDYHGSKSIASDTGIDQSTLSRFKNAQVGLTLPQLDKIIKLSDSVLIRRQEYKDMVVSLKTMSRLIGEPPSLKKKR